MPNFTFRLETLLRLRQRLRDACRTELAAAVEEQATVARRQAELDQRRGESLARRRGATVSGPLDLDRLAELRRYEESLSAKQRELDRRRQETARQVESRRAALVEADRDARVLENLESRKRQQYDADQKRQEIKLLDEVAALRRAEFVEHTGSADHGTI